MAERRDPFWDVVASFGVEEVFVLPEWIQQEVQQDSVSSPGIKGDMEALEKEIAGCMKCPLGATRKNIVFGEGNPESGILFVGEGPGANEDETGRPFVGRSGKLLDRIFASIGLDRSKLFIANIVKCRPPGNRTPSAEEAEICGRYLERQIEIMRPGIIVALGASAARTLLGTRKGIGLLRGELHRYMDTPVLATYHPAALLRSPALKRPVWEDMKRLKSFMEQTGLPRTEGETNG
ncbi:MAG: uracil-DNA glycosylase [Candidatus Fermentibacteraceae bacterium]|nr:uracil-DNA glycosylase [Candidatus Fermentibacteraceae bacterium]